MFTAGASGNSFRRNGNEYVWVIGRPEKPTVLGVLGQAEHQAVFAADSSAVGWTWNKQLRVVPLSDGLFSD